jgi:putative SOS response-associated peptidase YedK
MYTWEELIRLYRLTVPNAIPNLQPRYNVCPTTTIDAVVEHDGKRKLEPMRWGLVPAWWSKPLKEMKMATFNARAETVTEKPMFRPAFKNRCIIPASGYYEWKTIEGQKQPYYFTDKHAPILSIAGIWDEWTNREDGSKLKSCTMLITGPNMFVQDYHDRMPVLLRPEQFDGWLSGKSGREILVPAREELLQTRPVSRRVNNSRTSDEDATLIDAVAA